MSGPSSPARLVGAVAGATFAGGRKGAGVVSRDVGRRLSRPCMATCRAGPAGRRRRPWRPRVGRVWKEGLEARASGSVGRDAGAVRLAGAALASWLSRSRPGSRRPRGSGLGETLLDVGCVSRRLASSEGLLGGDAGMPRGGAPEGGAAGAGGAPRSPGPSSLGSSVVLSWRSATSRMELSPSSRGVSRRVGCFGSGPERACVGDVVVFDGVRRRIASELMGPSGGTGVRRRGATDPPAATKDTARGGPTSPVLSMTRSCGRQRRRGRHPRETPCRLEVTARAPGPHGSALSMAQAVA